MTEQEMIDILEDLVRNSSSATARIQAIKTLRMIQADKEEPAEASVSAFDELYEVSG
jgi:hypothetical protein